LIKCGVKPPDRLQHDRLPPLERRKDVVRCREEDVGTSRALLPTSQLSEKAKHNILGGTAARLFKLPPRNDKQKENLKKFGNLTAVAA
jgi:hypothetical protein